MKYAILILLLNCATPQYVDLTEEIETILNDETIPAETRFQVAGNLMKRQINEIRVVSKRNSKLESKVESNQWKVNLVDGIAYTLIALMIGLAIYIYFRFKTGFL